MLQDLRLAARTLARNPGFCAAACLTLAIGIGANTAVFSFVDALLLRALPVERPEGLVTLGPGSVGRMSRSDRPPETVFSFAQFQALRRDNYGVLAEVAAAPTFNTTAYWGEEGGQGNDPQTASCQLATGSYFRLLGVKAFLGRLLEHADDSAPGTNPEAVLSHAFWNDRFGADPAAIGSTIRLQGEPYRIVGVADPAFRGHTLEYRADLWVPMSMQPNLTRSPSRLEPTVPYETYWLNILARLKPGVTLAQADSAVRLRMRQIFAEQTGPAVTDRDRRELAELQVGLTPVARGLSRMRTSFRRPIILLWSATALVLLIACANLGNLLLARAIERRREIGVRQALGASRGNLLRLLLAESALLAGAGSACGCVLAYWLIPVARAWLREAYLPSGVEARLDLAALGFAGSIGALTVLAFGLAPALWASRDAIADTLRAGGPGATAARREARANGLLVAAQFALSLILLTVAGLFLRTLGELRAADLGLDPTRVLGIRLDPQGAGLGPAEQPALRRRILERVRAIPGIEAAAFTGALPLQASHTMRTIEIAGYVPAEDEDMNLTHVWASASYFETFGIRLLQGRLPEVSEADTAVVSRAFADRYFPDGSVLDGVLDGTARIVGVTADVRHFSPRGPPLPVVYRTPEDHEGFLRVLAVRTAGPAAATAERLRVAVRGTVPGMPIARGYQTIDALLDRAIALERMLAQLVAAFAGVALLLSCLGLYGVASYAVKRRTAEIGIRMALGAARTSVQGMVFGRMLVLLAAGAGVGLLGAYAAGRLVAGLLYGVEPFEWPLVGVALLALGAAATPAAFVPAWRAGRIEPSSALRHD